MVEITAATVNGRERKNGGFYCCAQLGICGRKETGAYSRGKAADECQVVLLIKEEIAMRVRACGGPEVP